MPTEAITPDIRGGAHGPFLEYTDLTDREPAYKLTSALTAYWNAHDQSPGRILMSPQDAAACRSWFPEMPIEHQPCIAPGQFWLDGGRDA